jgi:hypothetical protein
MRFAEASMGEYRIYAGALDERSGGGFSAAVVVVRAEPATPGLRSGSREELRDPRVAGGHRWESVEAALGYAMRGRPRLCADAARRSLGDASRTQAPPRLTVNPRGRSGGRVTPSR